MPTTDRAEQSVPLARRTQGLSRSPIRRMFDLAQSMDGADLVHFEIGEPDFDTPAHIIDAATAALHDGATHYTSNAGLPSLRSAIAADLQADYDPADEIIVTAGAMEALALTMLTIVDPGDEVLVPTPAWPNYTNQCEMVGATLQGVEMDAASGFDLDPAAIIDAMSSDTAAVIITNPSNPTGRVFDPAAVEAVVEAAAARGVYVIADEVYRDLTYDAPYREIAAETAHDAHVITVGSCSKTYAMTGWRVGWLAAAPAVVERAIMFHEGLVACAPAVSQHAALAALTGDRTPVDEMLAAFGRRREYVIDRIEALPMVTSPRPEGAFYAYLDFSDLRMDAETIATRLLEDHGVVTAPGTGFGSVAGEHVRISFATNREQIGRGFDRIEAFIEEHS